MRSGIGTSRIELRIAGLGGQGIVMLGRILATAAIYAGKEATQVETYGMQQRGGDVRADVVISDEEIDYPEVTQANVLIAMSQEAFDRHAGCLGTRGILVIDPAHVKRCEIDDDAAHVYRIPASQIAEKELGNPLVASVLMLGALLGLTGLLSKASTERAITESVPRKALELNLKAFGIGLEEGAKAKGSG
ncbi:MAG: 2-oxoacid:acceptor oxidoreductase family protein [Acidobacteria bacterium]|nr:2-oxoacid:acceptor oxidoreductase family protein [Acidobacteriota bacterium]